VAGRGNQGSYAHQWWVHQWRAGGSRACRRSLRAVPSTHPSHCSWFRVDRLWAPTPESGHISGYLAQALNLWSADVSPLAAALPVIVGLRNPDGSRMIRARYPNYNPELGFGPPLRADAWTAPTLPIQPAVEVGVSETGSVVYYDQKSAPPVFAAPSSSTALVFFLLLYSQVRPPTPNRTDSYSFIYYQGGYGGICSVPGFGYTETSGSQYWW
jgi:hypothetical protein